VGLCPDALSSHTRRSKFWCALLFLVAALPSCVPGTRSAKVPGMRDLLSEVEKALKTVNDGHLSTRRNTPWEILHAGIGLGLATRINDPDKDRTISVEQYFARGGPYADRSIYIMIGRDIGTRKSTQASELEWYPNQFLAYFAQMGLPKGFVLRCKDKEFTIADMVASAQRSYSPHEDNTFTIIAFACYLRPGSKWVDQCGQWHSIEELVECAIRYDAKTLTCGGCHYRSALALALRRQAVANPNCEIWAKVDQILEEAEEHARHLQNQDGSFPESLGGATERTRTEEEKNKARIQSTGHVLEWLFNYLREDEIQAEWVVRAVSFLARGLEVNPFDLPPTAARYHAAHALRMFRDCTKSRSVVGK